MSLILWHLGSTSPSKHNGSSSETTYQMLPGTSFPYRDLLRRNRKKRNTPISCSLKALSLYIFEPTAQFLYFFFCIDNVLCINYQVPFYSFAAFNYCVCQTAVLLCIL